MAREGPFRRQRLMTARTNRFLIVRAFALMGKPLKRRWTAMQCFVLTTCALAISASIALADDVANSWVGQTLSLRTWPRGSLMLRPSLEASFALNLAHRTENSQ